ncbi:MAG: hypothetical protein WCA78_06405 [Rhizomicrobium sp.]
MLRRKSSGWYPACLAALVIALALTNFASDVVLAYPSHSQSKHERLAQDAQAGDNEKRNTDALPALVQVVNAPKNEEKIDAYAAEQERKTSDTDTLHIAWVALILTGVQAFIFLLTLIFSIRAANAAKKAADVADRALTDLETPFLYPVIKSGTFKEDFEPFVLYDNPASPDIFVTPTVSFKIKNYGRTPALLRSVAARFEYLTEMPAEPRTDVYADYAVEPVLEAAQETSTTIKKFTTVPVNKAAYKGLKDGDCHLFLYGEMIFADIFRADYTQTFCLAWDFRTKGFIPWASRYNQRKRSEQKKA